MSAPRLQILQLEKVSESEKQAAYTKMFSPFKYAEEGGLLQLLDTYERACSEIEKELIKP